jgi:hypothetical protein
MSGCSGHMEEEKNECKMLGGEAGGWKWFERYRRSWKDDIKITHIK